MLEWVLNTSQYIIKFLLIPCICFYQGNLEATILHFAVMRKNAEAFAVIISHKNVDVNIPRKVTFWSSINEKIHNTIMILYEQLYSSNRFCFPNS